MKNTTRFLSAFSFVNLVTISALAQTDPPKAGTLKIGDPRPPVEFRLLSGGAVPTWKSLEGKVVVIDFWATWCHPCIAAFPGLNQLHHEFADKGVAFFSVTYEPDAYVRQFLEKHPLESEVGIDETFGTFKGFQAWGIPVVYVFDRTGKLVSAVHPNNFTAEVLTKALQGQIPDVPQTKPWNDPAGAEKYFKKLQRGLQEKYPSAKASDRETDAATVYAALLKRADTRPADMKEAQWHQQVAAKLESFANKYASEPEAAEARRNRLQHLQDAARVDLAARPSFIAATDIVWKDGKADPDERASARLLQLNLDYDDAVPGEELLALWKEFPGSDTVARAMTVTVTETVEADLRNRMSIALRDTPGVSESKRSFANKILSGEIRPLAARVGQLFDLKFKAVDGREVDLEKLVGKVVMIDFWATWCGPCLAEMPHIKQVYDELHGKGFEIVAISFDGEKSKLESYVRKERIPWPQYFDGKMWDSEIGKNFALRNLPTVALVDKKGVLRFANARNDFAAKVKELLAE
jgi:thiol-disulfide isomerase/thioredoxin